MFGGVFSWSNVLYERVYPGGDLLIQFVGRDAYKQFGISDSSLGVLYTLLDAEAPCSQYDLCSEWSIPKQTINTAVAALQKKGVAFLSPIPGTRNKKNIAFTEFGRDFAEKTVGILRMAELDALAELSPEERELYIRLNEKYNCRLIEKLYRIMDEVNQDRKDCD